MNPSFSGQPSEAFAAQIASFSQLCCRPSDIIHTERGLVATWSLAKERLQRLLQEHHSDYLQRGTYLFEFSYERRLGLVFGTDQFEVIRIVGTNGMNYDLSTEDIVRDMLRIFQTQPYSLFGIGHDFLHGEFQGPVTNCAELAEQFNKLCPDFVNQGAGTPEEAARQLRKTNKFFLWWD